MIATTQEQSQRLLRCGVSADTADMARYEDDEVPMMPWDWTTGSYGGTFPAWSLSALLGLLPKKITFGHRTNCRLKIQPIISSKDCISEVWQACYLHTSLKANAEAPELIDALYELLLWAIDHNHVKLD